MVAVEKLNRLTNGQQKSLHESVGKFLEENLQGMKELGLVDEALLTDYVAKSTILREDFHVRKIDPTLNYALCAIMAAVSNSAAVLSGQLVNQFMLRYQQMKNLDECLALIHSLRCKEIVDAEDNAAIAQGNAVQIDEFTAITDATTTIALGLHKLQPTSNQRGLAADTEPQRTAYNA